MSTPFRSAMPRTRYVALWTVLGCASLLLPRLSTAAPGPIAPTGNDGNSHGELHGELDGELHEERLENDDARLDESHELDYSGNAASAVASEDSAETAVGAQAAGAYAESEIDSDYEAPLSLRDRLSVSYFGILYGPTLGGSVSKPSTEGGRTSSQTFATKNFITGGYSFDRELSLNLTAWWTWEPSRSGYTELKDPFLTLAHGSWLNTGSFLWHGDVRFHFPVTSASRDADMLAGFQTIQYFVYQKPGSQWVFGTSGSARVNVFGPQGYGDDLELYAGPRITYQLSDTVDLNLLYEMGASHIFGAKAFDLSADGTDLEPGVSWNVLPNLNISPYLTIYTGSGISLANTALGMTVNWVML